MADLLSPGVQVIEIDASGIVPSVSTSTAVFAGAFDKGPVGTYLLITNEDELVQYFGKPTNSNYNDFLQASSFLKYGNTLLCTRAANTNGAATAAAGVVLADDDVDGFLLTGLATLPVTGVTAGITIGDKVVFGNAEGPVTTSVYEVTAITADTDITLDRGLDSDITLVDDDAIYIFAQSMNAVFEAVDVDAAAEAVTTDDEYVASQIVIENASDFETLESSIAMVNASDTAIKFISRNPGNWGNDIEIAIATPDVFGTTTPSLAFDGIGVDDLFEYAPTGDEYGIIIMVDGTIVETFTVSSDATAKDFNNKSIYVENVINSQSSYVFVKDNTANTGVIKPYVFENDGTAGVVAKLVQGTDSVIQNDDLLAAYELWSNKDEVDIDIVIANEFDGGVSATALAIGREDCIAFVGANYADVVGQKSAVATSNLVTWAKSGTMNSFRSMFVVACANYAYVYDRYNDKNRWINVAGHIGGLRAQTSTNRASWWASAGLERGQLKQITKLAFNPSNAQRDLLYKNSLNPIVSFPGQGIVMWGQKTALSKPSSFDRVNVRGLFNTVERALAKMAKYQVMEFNDNFTRNRIISMIKPYLSSVKAGRGIQDFLVICDETNNTPDVIGKNKLVVDIYIKPTYVAEFITLRFTNAGTNSFSEVIGG